MHRILVLLALFALVFVPLAHGTASLNATSSGLVISQVYAGGGNSGASYVNDYVELLNRSSSAIDMSGWSLQYASASSTSWAVTPLAGSVPAKHYFLVALASGGTGGIALPAVDSTGTTNMAVSGGKVALVNGTTALTCGASAGSCSAVDFVGWGTATDHEGSGAAPALSATLADVRTGAGCTDTDSNDDDFATDAPAPRDTDSPATSCSGGSGGPLTQSASVDVDVASALSLTLEHASLSFGTAAAGQTPAPLGDKLTVVSNGATGYSLTVHRSVFTPADLPLAAAVGTGALTRIPIAPATDLLLGSTSAPSGSGGDLWNASFGFATALPVVPPGHYTATVTFTVIGR
ncbi:MAG TPA: lamin tail domain-containing protein [Gaiellaceae bacterium]|jgi:hypothetical protein